MPYFKASKTAPEIYTPPSFSQGTDEQITEALERHRSGEIDLTEFWSVGDEREIGIYDIAASGIIGDNDSDSYPGQVKKFVILHGPNAFELSNDEGGGYNTFVIGMKNFLMPNASSTGKYGCCINGTADNTGGWKEMPRRAWCDNMFKPALPTEVQKWFKKFKYKASDGGGLDTSSVIENYFTLPSASEIFGPSFNTNRASASEDGIQLDYYKIAANKQKKEYDSGNTTKPYWLRTAYKANTTAFCFGGAISTIYYSDANIGGGCFLAPFGVV